MIGCQPAQYKVGKFDAVQITCSHATGAPFRDAAIAKLHKAGIGVIAMKVVITTHAQFNAEMV